MTDCHKLWITLNVVHFFYHDIQLLHGVTEVTMYYLRLLSKYKTVTNCVFITGWLTAKADKLNSFTTILFQMT